MFLKYPERVKLSVYLIFVEDNLTQVYIFPSQKHEKKCGNKTELNNPTAANIESIELSSDEEDNNDVEMEVEECESFCGQNNFMAIFALRGVNAEPPPPRRSNSIVERSLSPKKKKTSLKARREILKREKDLERSIPFSSPAGIVLTKKSLVDEDYNRESLREIEYDCVARPNTKYIRVKHRLQAGPENAVIREMRKIRHYYWPKRHFKSMSARINFEFLNRKMISELQPCRVLLERIPNSKIREIQQRYKATREEKERIRIADCVDLCSDSDDESLILDDDVKLDKIVGPMNFQGDFMSMAFQGSMFGLMPQSSRSIHTLQSAPLPFGNQIFFTHQNESMSSSYQQFAFNTASNVIVPQSNQLHVESSETVQAQRSIQQWIQNVSSENSFSISNQVTVINTN